MTPITVGFALCGSFCTFAQVIPVIQSLVNSEYKVIPIMSDAAYSMDTRFGKASEHIQTIESICSHPVLHTIYQTEPIGPKKMLDALIIEPCTGNTIGKLANGIYDTPVTLATKAHLRNNRPVIIAVSTNDALAGSAQNIGRLLGNKNYYFVPMGQDDPFKKPTSIVADFTKTIPTLEQALQHKQIQPILL